jgi:Holliday junction DNA helicase RuvA
LIARLDGKLGEKSPQEIILDVGGVGYAVRVPLSTFLELPGVGEPITLRIHTHVREDAFQLYGFLSEAERAAFALLLGISGVGPRLALAILSGLPVNRLVAAVQRSDVSALRGIPGVGGKTAERILVELRDKVNRLRDVAEDEPEEEPDEAVVSALANLGYPRAQAEKAVRAAAAQLEGAPQLEDLIREALRVASR